MSRVVYKASRYRIYRAKYGMVPCPACAGRGVSTPPNDPNPRGCAPCKGTGLGRKPRPDDPPAAADATDPPGDDAPKVRPK